MADIQPNYKVEQQRFVFQILEQQTACARSKLEIMEMLDRITKNHENIVATNLAIQTAEKEKAASMNALEKQRKKSQLASLSANVERQTLENLELEDRAIQMGARAKAEEVAKDKFISQLASLNKAHGELKDETIDSLITQCHSKLQEGA